MGRVWTHMAIASSGWGLSGRRFKSCLPDQTKPASEAAYGFVEARTTLRLRLRLGPGRSAL